LNTDRADLVNIHIDLAESVLLGGFFRPYLFRASFAKRCFAFRSPGQACQLCSDSRRLRCRIRVPGPCPCPLRTGSAQGLVPVPGVMRQGPWGRRAAGRAAAPRRAGGCWVRAAAGERPLLSGKARRNRLNVRNSRTGSKSIPEISRLGRFLLPADSAARCTAAGHRACGWWLDRGDEPAQAAGVR